MDEAVAAHAAFGFGAEGAEQAVPDDKHAAEIAVDAVGAHAMMDTVMRRRVEHKLDPTRQGAHIFAVDEEMMHAAHACTCRDKHWRDAERPQRERGDRVHVQEKAGADFVAYLTRRS